MSAQTVGPLALLYLPPAHGAHVPSFAVAPCKPAFADALLNPLPAVHEVTSIVLQATAPDPDLNSPTAHMVHVPSFAVEPVTPGLVAEALLNPSPGPHVLSNGEVMSSQAVGPLALLYLPPAHGAQAPSSAVAPTRSAPAVGLEKALPAAQVLFAGDMSSQAAGPAAVLYLPAAHAAHVPSFAVAPRKSSALADALEKALPWPHVLVLMSEHASAPG